ncbi:MAG: hypothetical protein FWH36_00875 [Lentimicrobiaceae bacterium]|nr:hypothetical protein [Lentimicrobiaceae bacterium]
MRHNLSLKADLRRGLIAAILVVCIVSRPVSVFPQGREIKEVFSASTRSFEVGDSCFVPVEYYLSGGYPPTTTAACDSIYAFLKQNPTVSIAIIVHSDFRPIPMGNDVLTEMRANRLKQEILTRGDIDSNRIVAIGMADNQPRIVTKEMHKEYRFFPVGQVLDREFITTLKDTQMRETAHRFNRRTVAKIIKK